jgi:hypothetical protein
VEIRLALAEKGYATMGFEKEFALSAEASALISVCAGCNAYVMADFTHPGRQPKNLLFYLCGEQAAALSVDGERLTLCQIAAADIAERIWGEMDWPAQEAAFSESAVEIALSTLAQAREQAAADPEGAAALLCGEGCSARLSGILLDGFREKAGYYTMCAADLHMRTFEHVICVRADSGAVRLALAGDSAENRWEILPVDDRILQKQIGELCRFAAKGEDQSQ